MVTITKITVRESGEQFVVFCYFLDPDRQRRTMAVYGADPEEAVARLEDKLRKFYGPDALGK